VWNFTDDKLLCSTNLGWDPASMTAFSLSSQESALGKFQMLLPFYCLFTFLLTINHKIILYSIFLQGCGPIYVQLYHPSTLCPCISGEHTFTLYTDVVSFNHQPTVLSDPDNWITSLCKRSTIQKSEEQPNSLSQYHIIFICHTQMICPLED
jgi:hypothetical protein